MLKIRSGIGYDIHRVKKGDGLYLGGVKVSNNLQFIAHSDGDVLIHALIDSLLGAIGEKDIGEHFPNTDNKYKNIKSEILLKQTVDILKKNKYEVVNIDSVLIAETPAISPFKERIKENIASILGIIKDDFNLKAKTKEKSDIAKGGDAIECYCISLIRSIS